MLCLDIHVRRVRGWWLLSRTARQRLGLAGWLTGRLALRSHDTTPQTARALPCHAMRYDTPSRQQHTWVCEVDVRSLEREAEKGRRTQTRARRLADDESLPSLTSSGQASHAQVVDLATQIACLPACCVLALLLLHAPRCLLFAVARSLRCWINT